MIRPPIYDTNMPRDHPLTPCWQQVRRHRNDLCRFRSRLRPACVRWRPRP